MALTNPKEEVFVTGRDGFLSTANVLDCVLTRSQAYKRALKWVMRQQMMASKGSYDPILQAWEEVNEEQNFTGNVYDARCQHCDQQRSFENNL